MSSTQKIRPEGVRRSQPGPPRRRPVRQPLAAAPTSPNASWPDRRRRLGQAHIFVLGGDHGRLAGKTDELKLDHPGFPKMVFAYHTITDTWIEVGESPANQVTTIAVDWNGSVVVPSGEVKPRVRTPGVWAITPLSWTPRFGAVNFSVLVVYLLAMVAVGAWFARRNKDTNDYFRGGQKIAWWAVGCSIFATMLSSITYMAIPAKAFAQDQVYLVGNLMIPAVAPIAAFSSCRSSAGSMRPAPTSISKSDSTAPCACLPVCPSRCFTPSAWES